MVAYASRTYIDLTFLVSLASTYRVRRVLLGSPGHQPRDGVIATEQRERLACMVSTWSAHGQHMVSTWSAHGQHMVSTWSAHGQHMVSTCTDLCVGEPVERKVKSSMHVRRASRFECLYPCQEAVFVGFNHRHKRWCVHCRIAGLNSVSHTVCAQRASTLLSEIVACDCQLSHGEKTMVV